MYLQNGQLKKKMMAYQLYMYLYKIPNNKWQAQLEKKFHQKANPKVDQVNTLYV